MLLKGSGEAKAVSVLVPLDRRKLCFSRCLASRWNRCVVMQPSDEQALGREQFREDLDGLFSDAQLRDAETEVDGAFTCLLTMEPYRDPVCTRSGQSYEKQALFKHFEKVSNSAAVLLFSTST